MFDNSWWRGAVRRIVGDSDTIPADLVASWPQLGRVRWRRGGLFLRIGGWCLGQPSVAGITIGRTVWLARGTPWSPFLLLHEYRHTEQFAECLGFPVQYVWESLRHGYRNNRFERDANSCADAWLRCPAPLSSSLRPDA
jgi:hypothetical protein